ncbi:low temperature requirement protein A [Rhodococcus sp. D2-41]|nr:low temperature requirement protein A [Rhodococcus sp. D2-41]
MRARDRSEQHRVSTPLELLFDLCFVVAVSQAAAQLHDALRDDRLGPGLLGYAMVFFAIWWAWMNFTWFASAYDTDDVPYRLLTLLQMAGVLVLAAGVPAALTHYDFTVITIGYVIMRVAMIGQWIRAAAEDPPGRPAALRYAVGIAVVQIGWVARLALPYPWDRIGFAVLVVAEMAVPAWAERGGRQTSWHPGHIPERYGGFTIIVLGEVILATLVGVQAVTGDHGVSASLLMIAIGALILVFALWWIYFTAGEVALETLRTALLWGYGHYFVFAAIAAIGAGLDTALNVAERSAQVPETDAAFTVAVPVAVVFAVLAVLHRITGTGTGLRVWAGCAGAVGVLAVASATGGLGLGGAVLGIGLVAAVVLTVSLVTTTGRRGVAVIARESVSGWGIGHEGGGR